MYLIKVHLFEREREAAGEGAVGEGKRDSPADSMLSMELEAGWIPGPPDYDLSQSQESEAQQTEPPRRPEGRQLGSR